MGGCRRAGAPNILGLRGGCCVASRWQEQVLSWCGGCLCLPLSSKATVEKRVPGSWLLQCCEPWWPGTLLGSRWSREGPNAQRRADPAAKGPEQAAVLCPQPSRPGTAGIPGHTRARSHTHTHTRSPARQAGAGLRRGCPGALRRPGSCCPEWSWKLRQGSRREAPGVLCRSMGPDEL